MTNHGALLNSDSYLFFEAITTHKKTENIETIKYYCNKWYNRDTFWDWNQKFYYKFGSLYVILNCTHYCWIYLYLCIIYLFMICFCTWSLGCQTFIRFIEFWLVPEISQSFHHMILLYLVSTFLNFWKAMECFKSWDEYWTNSEWILPIYVILVFCGF